MKKQIKTLTALGLAAVTVLSSSTTAFAGWTQDARGWKYTSDNGLAYVNTTRYIDGNNDGIAERYAFDAEGYLYMNQTIYDTAKLDGVHDEIIGSTVVNSEGQALDKNGNVMTCNVDKLENKPYSATALGVTFNDVEGRLNPLKLNENSGVNKYHSDYMASFTPYGKDNGTCMTIQTNVNDVQLSIKTNLQLECWEERYMFDELPLETYTAPNGVVWYGGVSTRRGETDVICGTAYNGKEYKVKIYDQNNRIDLQYVLTHLDLNIN